MAESYFRFAKALNVMNEEDVCLNYPQIEEAVPSEESSFDKMIWDYVSMLKRHGASVIKVVEEQIAAAGEDLIYHKLPPTCLIRLAIPSELAQLETQAPNYLFKKEGDFWALAFEGKQKIVKHIKGLDYLAYLLANPFREISAFDLTFNNNKSTDPPINGVNKLVLKEEGLSITGFGDAGPVLDNEARKQYNRRLIEIDKILDKAQQTNNPNQILQLKQEKQTIFNTLKGAVALGGRSRKSGDVSDRARSAITQASAEQSVELTTMIQNSAYI